MKNILIPIAAVAVMAFSSCSVGAGVQIRAAENSTPKDSTRTTVINDSNPKDSLQVPLNPEPVK